MVWIFFFINALLVFLAIVSDSVTIGGGVGNTHKNAPYVIEEYYRVFSIISLRVLNDVIISFFAS
jgi:hypothetical protein